MKKYILNLLLLFVVALSLSVVSSCSGDDPDQDHTTNTNGGGNGNNSNGNNGGNNGENKDENDDKNSEGTVEETVVSLKEAANGHKYVNLGLPSGTLWATCNVGASSPEEFGQYFAWAEVDTKQSYDSSNYKWGDVLKPKRYFYNGPGSGMDADNLSELLFEDDAARMNMGGRWRTPSVNEIVELFNNCSHKFTTYNGVDGYLFTSNKNKATLF